MTAWTWLEIIAIPATIYGVVMLYHASLDRVSTRPQATPKIVGSPPTKPIRPPRVREHRPQPRGAPIIPRVGVLPPSPPRPTDYRERYPDPSWNWDPDEELFS